MVIEGSRYETATIERVLTANGTRLPAIYPNNPYRAFFRYTNYTIVVGDRLDLLAQRFYQDAEAWWVIALANPEIMFPDDLAVGTVLRVPNAPGVFSG